MSNMTIDDFFKQQNENPKNKKKEKVKKEKPVKEKKVKEEGEKTGKNIFKLILSKIGILKDEEEIHEEYPKKYVYKRMVLVIFWITALIFMLYGFLNFIKPVRPIIQREEYIQAPSESDTAKAFALQFVREYLTYDSRDQSDYKNRVDKYVGNDVSMEVIYGWSQILESNIWSSKKLNDMNSVVTIYAKVLQGKDQDDKGTVKEVYVKVPVMVKGDAKKDTTGKTGDKKTVIIENPTFMVRDYPVFTAAFDNAEGFTPAYKGKSAADSTRTEIKKTLENFFKIYDKGTKEQIAYFMKDSKKIKGYENQYTFTNLDSLDVYALNKSENEVFTDVEITITDSMGTRFKQKFNFKMIKEKINDETRWYIEKIFDVGEEE